MRVWKKCLDFIGCLVAATALGACRNDAPPASTSTPTPVSAPADVSTPAPAVAPAPTLTAAQVASISAGVDVLTASKALINTAAGDCVRLATELSVFVETNRATLDTFRTTLENLEPSLAVEVRGKFGRAVLDAIDTTNKATAACPGNESVAKAAAILSGTSSPGTQTPSPAASDNPPDALDTAVFKRLGERVQAHGSDCAALDAALASFVTSDGPALKAAMNKLRGLDIDVHRLAIDDALKPLAEVSAALVPCATNPSTLALAALLADVATPVPAR